jgi:hypothetical protein
MTGTGARAVALLLVAALAVEPAAAQPAAPRPRPEPVEQPAPPAGVTRFRDQDAPQTRSRLRELLRQYPPSLSEVLRLDPSLMSDADYLASYPVLAQYLAEHPEIVRNPTFYLGQPRAEWDVDARASQRARLVETMFQIGGALFALVTVMFVIAWVLKLAVDHRRWLRMTRVQAETHTKLLDRFTSNEDLLAYVQTPAGRRFLESAPLAVEPAPAVSAPVGRILWSAQTGVVSALVGIALLYVSARLAADPDINDASPFMFMLGAVVVAVGVGFLLSSGVSYVISRRLGLLDSAASNNV